MDNIRKFEKGLQVEPVTSTSVDTKGEIEVLDASGKLNYHNGTSASPMVTEAHTATLTNKTLTSPVINTPDINGATLSLNDSDSAFNLEVQSTSTLTQDRTLTIDVNDGDKTLNITGNATLNGSNSGDVTVLDSATIDLTLTGQQIQADVVAGSIGNTELSTGILATKIADGSVDDTEFQYLNGVTSSIQTQLSARVVGPASSTDEAIARYDSTSGKIIQDSLVTITDAGIMSGATQLNVDNIRLDGNTIASTDVDGDIVLSPNGAGDIDLNIGTGTVNLGNSATVNNAGVGSGFTQMNVDNLRLDGNTLSSTDTNGNVVLDPDGTGQISAESPMRMAEQGSSPATPASGYSVIYPKTDGYLYYKNDAGAETRIQAGSGGINYILNSDAEGGTTGWATYADAAGLIPVDGTGGSPNITLTASTSSPLRGLQSFLITKDAANRQGQGVSYDFTIDPADKVKVLKISFDYEASSAYTGFSGTEYMVCYVYDITNAVQIPSSNIYIPQGSGTQEIVFNASTSTSYRLEFHIAGTGTSAWTYKYDNVMVGPQEVVVSAAIGDWQAYTPTLTAVGTPTNVSFQWRRVGSSMQIRGNFTCGTTSLAPAKLSLPSGYAYSSSFSAADYKNQFGTWTHSPAARQGYYFTDGNAGVLTNNFNTNQTELVFCHKGTQAGPDPDNISNFWTTGDYVSIDANIPIATWSSNIQIDNSRVEYASNSGMGDTNDTTSFVNDPAGNSLPGVTYTANRLKRVRFKNPFQQGDTVQLQFFDFNGSGWQDWGGTSSFNLYTLQNGVGYGFGALSFVNSTDIDVGFNQYRTANGATYGAAGSSWNGVDSRWKWRVVKYSNAVPVTVQSKTWALSSSTGSGFTTSSTSYVDVTGLTVTLNTSAATPVRLALQADGDATASNEGSIRIRRNPGNTADIVVAFLRNGTIISQNSYQVSDSGLSDVFEEIPPSSFQFVDTNPVSGSTTYKVQVKVSSASGAADVIYTRLFVQES